ncbi:hypothetical protein CEP52_016661 [Fusarium oligoseptatum]|uniref:VWFA domain-containing protein n=1 Tax=Fusarium oligoseptatum TaxID=2604345 RepID=A0A428S1S3_9HYPO|nr:hypothetical protein CEP52_016661 [Fusarium oligoseptatum]
MDKFNSAINFILQITGYVIAWVNKTSKGVIQKLSGLNPWFKKSIDTKVNRDGQPRNKDEFVANISKLLQGTAAERFFKNNPKFISELADKAASLADDPNTPICNKDLFPKTAQVTMHQQVLYCGDAIQLLRPDGNTPIGTNLKSKILEPLVYSKLPNDLKRPLLISVITDGAPSHEPRRTFIDAIAECGDKLEAAGLPRESVKFMIGQVGTANAATAFLQEIGNETRITNVVFVASEKLDASSNLEGDTNMDEWLIETLYAPIMKSEGKKNQ